jgi:hypothetical protein
VETMKNGFGKWSLVALLTMTFLQLISLGNAQTQTACQGYFCDKYLDTMFILMTHNSFSVSPDVGFPNQNHPEPKQLEAGIRGFSMDVHESDDGTVVMKHGLDPGLVDYETRVQQILDVLERDEYKHEFVLIQFEDNLDTPAGVDNACQAWGDRLITNFDINTSLGEYLAQGKQVLLMTNVESHVNEPVGMHNANKLLSENEYEWTSTATGPNMAHRRGPTGRGRYAKMMNYFCSGLLNIGSWENSAIVNTKARIQCHAQEFKLQSYAIGSINVIMIDYYDLPNNQPNALSAQTAIRNGDFGDEDGSDCIQGLEMSCKSSGSSCIPLGSCDDCCYGSSCKYLVFDCKCK